MKLVRTKGFTQKDPPSPRIIQNRILAPPPTPTLYRIILERIYRVSQKNGTPHCGLICRLSLSFYNLIDTGPFFCVYQEKNMW